MCVMLCAAERIWLVFQLEGLARTAAGQLATPGTSLLTEETPDIDTSSRPHAGGGALDLSLYKILDTTRCITYTLPRPTDTRRRSPVGRVADAAAVEDCAALAPLERYLPEAASLE